MPKPQQSSERCQRQEKWLSAQHDWNRHEIGATELANFHYAGPGGRWWENKSIDWWLY